MYDQHFGLTKTPFKITPDPELFFPGGNRGAVLDALLYAVSRGEGIVKVVGEVGSGKTMLCRMLERELPAQCEIIYLANPNLGPDEILQAIVFELRLTPPATASKPELMHLLHDYLLRKHVANRRVVMFVEEAQCVPLATLEEIRLLSNLETAQDKLLQIVLFGQPELDHKLAQHEIRQLNERITYRFRLAPLAAAEIRDYLNSRLRASGFRGAELFERGAIRALARYSKGLLRRVNVLADKALLAAYTCGARRVTRRHIVLAAQDSELIERSHWWLRWWPAATLSGVLALLVVGSPTSAVAPTPWTDRTPLITRPASALLAAAIPALPTHYGDLAALASILPAANFATAPATLSVMPMFATLDDMVGASDHVLTLQVDAVGTRW